MTEFFWALVVTCVGPWSPSDATMCLSFTRAFVSPAAQTDCVEYINEVQHPSVVEALGLDPIEWQEKMTAPNCFEGGLTNAKVEAQKDFIQSQFPQWYTTALRNRERTGKPKNLTVN